MHSAHTLPPPQWKLREVGGSNPPTSSRAAQDSSVESASGFAGRTAHRTPSTRKRILGPPNCHRHSRLITILSYPTHPHKHKHKQRQSVLYTNFNNKSKRERERERERKRMCPCSTAIHHLQIPSQHWLSRRSFSTTQEENIEMEQRSGTKAQMRLARISSHMLSSSCPPQVCNFIFLSFSLHLTWYIRYHKMLRKILFYCF